MKKKIFFFLAIFPILCGFQRENEKRIRIFMIGDSTMANKAPEKSPETGWGMVFNEFFDGRILVENHAMNGRSSKSFIAEGRWQKVFDQLQEGDFVFIQFGHNDQKTNNPNLYTNPTTTFRANLEKYVTESRSKGAVPILLSPVVRRNFNEEGVLMDTHGIYPLITRLVAERMSVPFIDLQLLTERKVIELGSEESKKLYLWLDTGENANYPDGVKDNTHFNRNGALSVAKMVVDELKYQHILE